MNENVICVDIYCQKCLCFHFECIPLCISRILFSSVENTIIFCCDFLLGLLILNLNLLRVLKLNVCK